MRWSYEEQLASLSLNEPAYQKRFTYQIQARKTLNKMVAQLMPLISPRAMMTVGKATAQKMYLAKKIWYVAASLV
jgi:hypothetical protein